MFSFQQPPRRWLDELNRALLILGAGAWIVSLFFQTGTWPRLLCTAVMGACLLFGLIRALSGNAQRTADQNRRFLTATTGVREFFRNPAKVFRERPRRAQKARKNPSWSEIKKYKYLICPQCAQRLRVPRGKGKLRVTCTRCGNRFETRS